MSVELIPGDCLNVLPELLKEDRRFDACITDPPYHLASIVKRFGGENAAPARVKETGVYARSSAGFMGKQWDSDIAMRPETWALVRDLMKPGAHLVVFGGTRTHHRIWCAIEDAGFEIRDTLMWVYGQGFPKSHNMKGEHEGKGTALKPAQEPICLARKPLDGTVAANVGKWGVGALNIDACRVAGDDAQGGEYQIKRLNPGASVNKSGEWKQDVDYVGFQKPGRWPANLLHDGSQLVLDLFPSTNSAARGPHRMKRNAKPARDDGYGMDKGEAPPDGLAYGDSGSAARFFYCAKASAADREGSKHPTVKPIALLRWLARLVTPPNGSILDPFAGSGTMGVAADAEGYNAVLIEREEEYRADIIRRLERLKEQQAQAA